jgi:hypothetical protein
MDKSLMLALCLHWSKSPCSCLQYPNDAVRAVAEYQCLPKLPNVVCQNFPDFFGKISGLP